jgi:hypothetical protein
MARMDSNCASSSLSRRQAVALLAAFGVTPEALAQDASTIDPRSYRVVLENDRVRVLEYRDVPGDRTTPHSHPDSVMVTLSDFDRKLVMGDQKREVSLVSGRATWLPAQTHMGENIGSTPTHTIFVELKEPGPGSTADPGLGPQ